MTMTYFLQPNIFAIFYAIYNHLTWQVLSPLHGLKQCSVILLSSPIFQGQMTHVFKSSLEIRSISQVDCMTFNDQTWNTLSP